MKEDGIIRKIDWSIDPAKMQSTSEETLEKAEQQLDEIAKTPEGEESLKTLLDFEEVGAAAGEILSPLAFIKYVSSDKQQRDAAEES